ncbi:hypothetical protein L3X38_016029 [Prunus dulcis]|uniref:Uncharacterized protein n=1 Tax=Prunus dulcis TaxID=3755 RepID=A0AAD4W566_PRUDU|nr:hypothetical protein L3X38_016029 [Prunus dulcis]
MQSLNHDNHPIKITIALSNQIDISATQSVTSRDWLRRSTILSALGPPLCLHDFVSGSTRATSQRVTHPGIALALNSFNFGVPTTPKLVSSQKDQLRRSTILSALGPPLCPHRFVSGSTRATSQWVTHYRIALALNSLNFGVPTTLKSVSSQNASC